MSIAVSQQFKDNIYPTTPNGVPSMRRTVAEVTYTLTAVDSKEGGVTVLPPGNSISRPHQIMNEIRRQIAPVYTMEHMGVTLDGRFLIPPPVNQFPEAEIGWWSEAFSDDDGYFDEPLVIVREFDLLQTFNTLGIVFDIASDNYCSEFDIEFYDGFNTMVLLQEIRGNDTANFNSPQGGIDVKCVRITLYRTHKPRRFARVIELDFGQILTFRGGDMISVSNINEADPSGKRFITPEFDITVLNKYMETPDGETVKQYDIFDSRTFAPYFLQRQRFDWRHGLVLPDDSVEWVHCGTYFLARWQVQDRKVRFIAKGNTFQLEDKTWFHSSFNELPIGTLVRQFYPWANIALNTPPITGYFGNINYRRALTYLIELSCCLVYEDRDNMLQFVDYTTQTDRPPVDTMRYNILFDTPVADQSEYYNSISLAEWDMSIERRQISRTRHAVGHVQITFGNPVQFENGRIDLDYEITDGFEFQNAVWYTMFVIGDIVKVDPDVPENEAEITINGNSISLTRTDVIYHAPWYTGIEELRPYNVNLPFFIRGAEHFVALRRWFLARKFDVIKKQLSVEARYKGNMAREISDIVDFQFTRAGQIQPVHMTGHSLRYVAGGLDGKVKAVGDNPLLVRR